jgi:hypothetical protein
MQMKREILDIMIIRKVSGFILSSQMPKSSVYQCINFAFIYYSRIVETACQQHKTAAALLCSPACKRLDFVALAAVIIRV